MKRFATGALTKLNSVKAGLLTLNIEPHASDLTRLLAAASQVQGRLYVQLHGNWSTYGLRHVQSRLVFVYFEAAKAHSNVDVRVILPGKDSSGALGAPDVEVFFGFEAESKEEQQSLTELNSLRTNVGLLPLRYFPVPLSEEIKANNTASSFASAVSSPSSASSSSAITATTTASTNADNVKAASCSPVNLPSSSSPSSVVSSAQYLKMAEMNTIPSFTQVCMGGTCDRLHAGHKLLFSLAALITSERLLIGVTSSSLLVNKNLAEFVQPTTLRSVILEEFLYSIKPSISYDLVEIFDPCGPAITDSTLKAIVVSEETKVGGELCNSKRREKGMNEMDVLVVDLVEDTSGVSNEKLSSTALRIAELGKLRGSDEGWVKRTPDNMPYTVGLTGGIACGKSTVGKAIATELGTPVIDCDLLGHEAYLPGSECFKKLVEVMGAGIVGEDSAIDRRKLGGIVFGDAKKMDELNAIVRPVILHLLQQRLEQLGREGVNLVVVEAAILLEANWESYMDETWVVMVPPKIARERLMERNKITAEQADQRIQAQMTNQERIKRSNVVLSAQSDALGQTSRDQLKRAWPALLARSEARLRNASSSSLAGRWWQLTQELNVSEPLAARWWRVIRDEYASSNRCYHSLTHLEELMQWFDKFQTKLEHPDLVQLAIFFHDVIYNATRGDNEAASAELFVRFASEAFLPANKVEPVKAWIIRTAKHMAGPATGDLAFFLDFDLAVLGKTLPAYATYAHQIRLEYNHVPSNIFKAKRPDILKTFLQTKQLYFTPEVREDIEARARTNVTWEISKL